MDPARGAPAALEPDAHAHALRLARLALEARNTARFGGTLRLGGFVRDFNAPDRLGWMLDALELLAVHPAAGASQRAAREAFVHAVGSSFAGHDPVCTPALRSMAGGSDVVAVAAGRAKHAATDCISAHLGKARPSRLVYAAGNGSSGILAALEAAGRK